MDIHTPQCSKNIRAIKATGTKDEVRLAKAYAILEISRYQNQPSTSFFCHSTERGMNHLMQSHDSGDQNCIKFKKIKSYFRRNSEL